VASRPAIGICSAEIEAGTLVRVLPQWFAGGATITVLTPHRRCQLPSVSALSSFITQHLPKAMSLCQWTELSAQCRPTPQKKHWYVESAQSAASLDCLQAARNLSCQR
jgi:hypothetical protein